jgi:hypothetical protein
MPTATFQSHAEISRRRDLLIKAADGAGDGQDQAFESAFANLAHAYLKDRAPGLLDYEVGFQLLDRNEDNTKAVGVRGFKVGTQILFAPVFFIDGDLKGHELLYIKNDDQFVPLKENWINYLLQKKPMTLGDGIHRDTRRVGVRRPSLARLVHSPSKFASTMPSWLQEGLPGLAYAATTSPYTDPRYSDLRDVPDLLKTGGIKAVRALLKYAEAYPAIARGLDRFYDMTLIRGLLADLKAEKAAAARDSVLSGLAEPPRRVPPGWARGRSVLGDAEPYHPIKQGSLQVYTYDQGWIDRPNKARTLDEDDYEKLLRDATLIKDERKQDEGVSVPYKVEMRRNLVNPDQSGLYDVMVKPDVFEKMIVLIAPAGPAGKKAFCTVARVEDDPKGWINIHPSYVLVSKQYSDQQWKDWAEGLPDVDTLTGDSDGQYIVVGDTAAAGGTLPFIVESALGNSDGYKILNVRFDMYSERGRPQALRDASLWGYYESQLTASSGSYDRWADGERLHAGGRRGTEFRTRLGDVYAPPGSRILKVEKADYPDDQWDPPKMDDVTTKLFRPIKSLTGGKGASKTPPIAPTNFLDVELGLWREKVGSTIPHHRISVRFDGSTARLDGGPALTETQAVVRMVRDLGFREKAARAMLGLARANDAKPGGPVAEFRVEYAPWVKHAANPNLLDDSPVAPSIPDPRYDQDSYMGSYVPAQSPQEDFLPVEGMQADPGNRELYRPTVEPDPYAAHAATQAAATGQREIFDTSILGGLLKTTRDDQLTDRYLGDLMKGMDRIGRILFQLYWHREAFEERYGKTHVPELEDMLRNSFEDIGDLVLDLKQKTIEPDPAAAGQRIDFKSDTDD